MKTNLFSADISLVPIWVWVILGVILLTQGIIVFIDASKRGENKWLWAFFVMTNTPSNIIIYFIVTRFVSKAKRCYNCGNKISKNAKYCSNCGQKQLV